MGVVSTSAGFYICLFNIRLIAIHAVMPQVSIVTFNLLNKPSRWEQRRRLIAAELEMLQPDLIALQEVSLLENSAHWLADRLGGYTAHVSSRTGPLQGVEGVAVLSRLPVEQCSTIDLQAQHRVAQSLVVRVGHAQLLLVNGHYYFHVVDHIKRVRQVQHLLSWLGHSKRDAPVIICGDFNDTPGSRSIALMQQHFVSAHQARHGREPDYTCPTPLRYERSAVRNALSRLGNYALNQSLQLWRGTLDYIFVNAHLQVLDCHTVLERPHPHDLTLYPSDHVGLRANLVLR